MSPLEFKYSRPTLIMMAAGVPILVLASTALIYASYLSLFTQHALATERLESALAGALGIGFYLLLFEGLRNWRSILASYSLDHTGVWVGRPPMQTVLKWTDLRSARYRRGLGQIELRFEGYPHLVVLYNVSMDINRAAMHAALALIEGVRSGLVKRSIF